MQKGAKDLAKGVQKNSKGCNRLRQRVQKIAKGAIDLAKGAKNLAKGAKNLAKGGAKDLAKFLNEYFYPNNYIYIYKKKTMEEMEFQGGGTWAYEPAKLKKLMKKPLLAKNADRVLYNVFGDDQLFDFISNLKKSNPNANIWKDNKIMNLIQGMPSTKRKSPKSPKKSPKSPRKSSKSPKKSPHSRCPNGSRRNKSTGKCVKY